MAPSEISHFNLYDIAVDPWGFSRGRFRRIKRECLDVVIEKSVVGDWFLLYLLGQNVDPVIFKDVVHELAKKLGFRSKDMSDA